MIIGATDTVHRANEAIVLLRWNQALVVVVETCSLASVGELSVLSTRGTSVRWSSTTRAGLRVQFTALEQRFARVSVPTIGYTFYQHSIFCSYNTRKLLVSLRQRECLLE